jgi:hypothetical protein
MKFEKTLFKMSFIETIKLSVLLLFVLNGFIFLISYFQGNPRFIFYDSAWITQIFFPIVYSIILTSINRNGVLRVADYDDLTTLMQQIEHLTLKRGYIVENTNHNNILYTKKTKLGRFFNYFFRENINVQTINNEVLIFSKRNMLLHILMKLKKL